MPICLIFRLVSILLIQNGKNIKHKKNKNKAYELFEFYNKISGSGTKCH